MGGGAYRGGYCTVVQGMPPTSFALPLHIRSCLFAGERVADRLASAADLCAARSYSLLIGRLPAAPAARAAGGRVVFEGAPDDRSRVQGKQTALTSFRVNKVETLNARADVILCTYAVVIERITCICSKIR